MEATTVTRGHDDAPKRRVLVAGGTSGIGAAIVQRFARSGAEVTAAGLGAKHAAASLTGANVVKMDLREPDQVEQLMSGLPSLDVLVNAAGVLRQDEATGRRVPAGDIQRGPHRQPTGTMRASVAARVLLAETAGCIVNVASMLSYFGGPRVPGYAASKGGIAQLTKSLAVAWAADGIRVNAVAPGWIRTNMTTERGMFRSA